VAVVESTKLSSKGQVIIPKHIRSSYHWETGQELIVIDTGSGILLKPKEPLSKSKLNDVAGCLRYTGAAKTIDEMNDAVAKGIVAKFYGCD
jgi:AbrB family looped-hinge helix DNA binding protein